MDEAINSIPPEAWPLLTNMLNVTIVVTMVWTALAMFAQMRRDASNLTTVASARAKKKAQPDFLEPNKKRRKEAIKAGEAYDQMLDKREHTEAQALRRETRRKESAASKIGRLTALAMAVFSLATMVSGTIFQVSIMGRYWEQFSAAERLTKVVQDHPVGVAVTLIVIGYNAYFFFKNRKWEQQ